MPLSLGCDAPLMSETRLAAQFASIPELLSFLCFVEHSTAFLRACAAGGLALT